MAGVSLILERQCLIFYSLAKILTGQSFTSCFILEISSVILLLIQLSNIGLIEVYGDIVENCRGKVNIAIKLFPTAERICVLIDTMSIVGADRFDSPQPYETIILVE